MSDLEKAIQILKQGGVVVFPTETAYGLAADATNPKAVQKVAWIKNRPEIKSFPLIAASLEMVERCGVLSDRLRKLAQLEWPGPLTIVMPKKTGVKCASNVVHSDGTIAVRVSSHEIANALSRGVDAPIVSTSANITGEPLCYSLQEVRKQFLHNKYQPDFMIDGGILEEKTPSTIIKEENGEIIVLRKGDIQIKNQHAS